VLILRPKTQKPDARRAKHGVCLDRFLTLVIPMQKNGARNAKRRSERVKPVSRKLARKKKSAAVKRSGLVAQLVRIVGPGKNRQPARLKQQRR
jgi:hypothetical protein